MALRHLSKLLLSSLLIITPISKGKTDETIDISTLINPYLSELPDSSYMGILGDTIVHLNSKQRKKKNSNCKSTKNLEINLNTFNSNQILNHSSNEISNLDNCSKIYGSQDIFQGQIIEQSSARYMLTSVSNMRSFINNFETFGRNFLTRILVREYGEDVDQLISKYKDLDNRYNAQFENFDNSYSSQRKKIEDEFENWKKSNSDKDQDFNIEDFLNSELKKFKKSKNENSRTKNKKTKSKNTNKSQTKTPTKNNDDNEEELSKKIKEINGLESKLSEFDEDDIDKFLEKVETNVENEIKKEVYKLLKKNGITEKRIKTAAKLQLLNPEFLTSTYLTLTGERVMPSFMLGTGARYNIDGLEHNISIRYFNDSINWRLTFGETTSDIRRINFNSVSIRGSQNLGFNLDIIQDNNNNRYSLDLYSSTKMNPETKISVSFEFKDKGHFPNKKILEKELFFGINVSKRF